MWTFHEPEQHRSMKWKLDICGFVYEGVCAIKYINWWLVQCSHMSTLPHTRTLKYLRAWKVHQFSQCFFSLLLYLTTLGRALTPSFNDVFFFFSLALYCPTYCSGRWTAHAHELTTSVAEHIWIRHSILLICKPPLYYLFVSFHLLVLGTMASTCMA